jgi:formylglycine-generating enzyme required for sulfatase activity
VGKFSDPKLVDTPFCLVPTGKFQMGGETVWENSKPIHLQRFTEPFYIAQFPITNAQWRVAVEAGVVGEPQGEKSTLWYNDPKSANTPVVGITWFDVQYFAQWVGCRLPTEREWEYAARGVDNLIYPWGNDWKTDKAIHEGNSGAKPWDVTSKPDGASWVGARHLSGNVWEWTASLEGKYPYPDDGKREVNTGNRTDLRRVLRGGSWDDSLINLRTMLRLSLPPDFKHDYLGFRLARSV